MNLRLQIDEKLKNSARNNFRGKTIGYPITPFAEDTMFLTINNDVNQSTFAYGCRATSGVVPELANSPEYIAQYILLCRHTRHSNVVNTPELSRSGFVV